MKIINQTKKILRNILIESPGFSMIAVFVIGANVGIWINDREKRAYEIKQTKYRDACNALFKYFKSSNEASLQEKVNTATSSKTHTSEPLQMELKIGTGLYQLGCTNYSDPSTCSLRGSK